MFLDYSEAKIRVLLLRQETEGRGQLDGVRSADHKVWLDPGRWGPFARLVISTVPCHSGRVGTSQPCDLEQVSSTFSPDIPVDMTWQWGDLCEILSIASRPQKGSPNLVPSIFIGKRYFCCFQPSIFSHFLCTLMLLDLCTLVLVPALLCEAHLRNLSVQPRWISRSSRLIPVSCLLLLSSSLFWSYSFHPLMGCCIPPETVYSSFVISSCFLREKKSQYLCYTLWSRSGRHMDCLASGSNRLSDLLGIVSVFTEEETVPCKMK